MTGRTRSSRPPACTREQLPKLHRPGEIMGEVTAEAAKLTGLKAGTPVIAGGGDGQCAGTGANIFLAGRAYVNLGTAAVSGSYGKTYAVDRAFRSMVAVGEEGFSFETAIRTGTFLVNWMVERLFNVSPGEEPRRSSRRWRRKPRPRPSAPMASCSCPTGRAA